MNELQEQIITEAWVRIRHLNFGAPSYDEEGKSIILSAIERATAANQQWAHELTELIREPWMKKLLKKYRAAQTMGQPQEKLEGL